MLLTKSTNFIIGPVATLLGYIMEAIFNFLSAVTGGNAKTGVAIILMTIVIYVLMLPLTYRQQKFSKLQAKMMPEIQKVQAKYRGKRDQESMARMNEETKEIYAKYGVSQSGSCVQLLIQMPILFALYRVIYNIPAYVSQVRDVFTPLVDGLINKVGIAESAGIMEQLSVYNQFTRQFNNENFLTNTGNYAANTFIDVLNRASTADWALVESNNLIVNNGLADAARNAQQAISSYNSFLGLNIGDAPLFALRNSGGSILVIIMALLIPLLAALTQYINFKLMPQAATPNSGNDAADSMANSMKTMNTTMPILSAVMCFTLPAGLGLYWIAGAVVRSVQQIFINRHIDKLDIDSILEANQAKAKEKSKNKVRKDAGTQNVTEKKFVEYSSMKTKNMGRKVSLTQAEEEALEKKLAENKGRKYRAGSMAEKVNLVNKYNNPNQE